MLRVMVSTDRKSAVVYFPAKSVTLYSSDAKVLDLVALLLVPSSVVSNVTWGAWQSSESDTQAIELTKVA